MLISPVEACVGETGNPPADRRTDRRTDHLMPKGYNFRDAGLAFGTMASLLMAAALLIALFQVIIIPLHVMFSGPSDGTAWFYVAFLCGVFGIVFVAIVMFIFHRLNPTSQWGLGYNESERNGMYFVGSFTLATFLTTFILATFAIVNCELFEICCDTVGPTSDVPECAKDGCSSMRVEFVMYYIFIVVAFVFAVAAAITGMVAVGAE